MEEEVYSKVKFFIVIPGILGKLSVFHVVFINWFSCLYDTNFVIDFKINYL